MCGIVGVYYFNESGRAHEADIRLMTDAMIHRGPNDEGFFVDGQIGLGMRRLSIIDLEGGHQPIYSPSGDKVIVFNGEAYNYLEERKKLEQVGRGFSTHTDTEVVLQLFDEYEEQCFEHINGMFGLAVWDKQKKKLTIARDRIGIKPLYYYRDQQKLVFASEIKSILAFPGVESGLDRDILPEYLKYGYTSTTNTLYKKINKIPPGHYMQIEDGQVSISQYWNVSYADKLSGSDDELSAGFYELFESSINLRMRSDVPIGAFLSGGIDSSSIVHMMSKLDTQHKVNTYSIGFGAGFKQYNELDAARRFADHYGTNHHEIEVRPDVSELLPELVAALDEPIADSSFIMTYLVSKLAKESSTVILSGVGGDELFGGYRRYLNVTLNGAMAKLPAGLRNKLLLPLVNKLPEDRNHKVFNYFRLLKAYMQTMDLPAHEQYLSFTSLLSDDLVGSTLGAGAGQYTNYHAKLFAECDSPELLDKLLYIDLKTSLPEQLLMLTDKMSMYTSVEARVPYLDHRVVEYVARLPARVKIKRFNLRYLQKHTFRPHLPGFVFNQKKKGFGAPVGSWVRKELKGLVMDLLGEQRLQQQGIFDAKTVQTLVNSHMKMESDYTDLLMGLLTFQIWYEQNGFS